MFTFCQGWLSRTPAAAPAGKVCVSAASLCAHAGAPSFPPARPPSAPAPVRALRCGLRPGGPGSPGHPGGGRRARAGRRAGRPPRASRSGKLGRTAATVCPAPQSEWRLPHSRPRAGGGGGETRRAPLRSPGPSGRQSARRPGREDPHLRGGGGARPLDVCSSGLVWGVHGLPVSGLGRAFALRVLRASPIAVGHSRFGGHPRPPARSPDLSAISPARLRSEAAPTEAGGSRLGLSRGPRTPRAGPLAFRPREPPPPYSAPACG